MASRHFNSFSGQKQPWRYHSYLKRLIERVNDGGVNPIHLHTFAGFDNGVKALQFLQRAQNIGKVIISAASTMMCESGATALLSGGTGSLGVVTARFMVEE